MTVSWGMLDVVLMESATPIISIYSELPKSNLTGLKTSCLYAERIKKEKEEKKKNREKGKGKGRKRQRRQKV
jgi:hypothetical protein